jgi:hypothetical protein
MTMRFFWTWHVGMWWYGDFIKDLGLRAAMLRGIITPREAWKRQKELVAMADDGKACPMCGRRSP